MNLQQHAQIKKIFLTVIELSADEIKTYISSQTNDKQVIKQVLELVDTYQNNTKYTQDFVQDVADNISRSSLLFPSDRYTLIKKIGQGGMGDVYLAQRNIKDIKQKVAIKILYLNDKVSKKRFSQETSILSQLSHPNISQFIDADFLNDGRPYVVMEFAEGKTITDYCKDNNLNVDNRLTLFNSLCQAVQHAHQNLIIHRDIKPENILVDNNGEVKLLDFGIAKIMQNSDNKTNTQMRAMTPAYASPEQIMGRAVGVSSDVYSLGVLLYELLTNVIPYEPKDYSSIEFEKLLKTSSPIKPSLKVQETRTNQSKWKNTLIGDIDNITIKALQFDIVLRYQTVAELADDLNRYKINLPILAKTPSISYRVRKYFKRNKSSIAVMFVLIVIVGTFIYQIQKQKNLALFEKHNAEAVTDILIKSFKNADPTKTLGAEIKAIDILKESTRLIYLNSKINGKTNPSMALIISEVYYNLGLYEESEKLINSISDNYKNFLVKDKEKYTILKVQLLTVREDYTDALKFLDTALSEIPNSNNIKYVKGVTLKGDSKLEEARNVFTNLMNKIELHDELFFSVCNKLVEIHMVLGKYDDAHTLIEFCLLQEESINILEKSKLMRSYGLILQGEKEYNNSIDVYLDSLELLKQIYDESHIDIAYVYSRIGSNYALLEKYQQGLFYHEKSLKIKQKVYGGNHPKTGTTLYNIGYVYFGMENYVMAEKMYTQAVDLILKNNLKESTRLAFFYKQLGQTYIKNDKFSEAESVYYKSIDIFENKKGTYIYRGAEMRVLLANLYFIQNKLIEAKKQLNIALPNMYTMHKKGDELQVLAEKLKEDLKEIIID